jgi:hypothetical protein
MRRQPNVRQLNNKGLGCEKPTAKKTFNSFQLSKLLKTTKIQIPQNCKPKIFIGPDERKTERKARIRNTEPNGEKDSTRRTLWILPGQRSTLSVLSTSSVSHKIQWLSLPTLNSGEPPTW